MLVCFHPLVNGLCSENFFGNIFYSLFYILFLERKPLVSCLDIVLSLDFNQTKTDNEKYFLAAMTYFNNFNNPNCSYNYQNGSLATNDATVTGNFKILPKSMVMLNSLTTNFFKHCENTLSNNLKTSKANFLKVISDSLATAVDVKIVSSKSCCSLNNSYCCPTGHLVRTTGQTVAASYCSQYCKYFFVFILFMLER